MSKMNGEMAVRDEAVGRLKGVAENAVSEAKRMVVAVMPELGGGEHHELVLKLAEAMDAFERAELEMSRAFSDVRMRFRMLGRAMGEGA